MQREKLAEIESELKKLRQLAKEKDLSRTQYAIAMLLSDLSEIQENRTILSEANRINWMKIPKQLKRSIDRELMQPKKIDSFNIKRVKDEELPDVSNELLRKTLPTAEQRSSMHTDSERSALKQMIDSLK